MSHTLGVLRKGITMNLQEALLAAESGNFVTNEYFSQAESLHYYRGTYYYEDGAVVPKGFLLNQSFALNGEWSIAIPKEDVDFDRLRSMHSKSEGYMLASGSYMECRK